MAISYLKEENLSNIIPCKSDESNHLCRRTAFLLPRVIFAFMILPRFLRWSVVWFNICEASKGTTDV